MFKILGLVIYKQKEIEGLSDNLFKRGLELGEKRAMTKVLQLDERMGLISMEQLELLSNKYLKTSAEIAEEFLEEMKIRIRKQK